MHSSQLGSLLADAWQVPAPPPTVPLVYEARVAQYKEAAEASRDVLHRSELDAERLRQQLSAAELERDDANRRMVFLQQRVGLDGDVRESLKADLRAGFSQVQQQFSETARYIVSEIKALLNTEVQNVFSQMSALEFARVTEAMKRSQLESAQEALSKQDTEKGAAGMSKENAQTEVDALTQHEQPSSHPIACAHCVPDVPKSPKNPAVLLQTRVHAKHIPAQPAL